MDIIGLVNKIKEDKNCKVLPPVGIPSLAENDHLPDDIMNFYEICGGIHFFEGAPFEFIVVGPNEVVQANPIIVGELCEEDISSRWYIICKDLDDNYITFDASADRNGRCYDSFWDRHGVVGECAIVSLSFTDLLLKLYESGGKEIFWLSNDFNYIGDAYDE